MTNNPWGEETQLDLGVYPACGMVLRDRYKLLEIIGFGGMGQVYKALDEQASEVQERQIFRAIKVLPPELVLDERAIKGIKREALNAEVLSHENIINVMGFDRDSRWTFIIMELLEGKTLNTLLADAPNGIDFSVLKPLLAPIANALDYAHQKKLIHRDIKPNNIFLTHSGRVVIIDFGLSYEAEKSLSRLSNTSGTRPYMPPEAHVGGSRPTVKNDIYALAVTIYELLTGDTPYEGALCSTRNDDSPQPAKPPSLTTAQWHTLVRALHYNPAKRPDSAGEFIKELCSDETQAESGKRVLKWGLATSLVAALALGGYTHFQSQPVAIDEVKGEETKRTAQAETKRKAEAEAKRKAQAEAKRKAQAETKRKNTIAQRIWAWADEFSIPADVIPRDATQLFALQTLDLNRSFDKYKDLPKITYLPPEIGKLTQLQTLYLSNNRLTALPPEIAQLTQLQTLWLYNNRLIAVPPEIAQLTQLQTLSLSSNQLTAVPPEIGLLTQLQELSLGYNQLTSVPLEIVHLQRLSWVDLSDNPALKLTAKQKRFFKKVKTVKR